MNGIDNVRTFLLLMLGITKGKEKEGKGVNFKSSFDTKASSVANNWPNFLKKAS